MKSRITKMVFSGTLALGLSGCGGVRDEAKVATALQTLLVLSVESAIRYNIEDVGPSDPLDCAEGGTYTPGASLASLVDFITNPSTNSGSISGYYDFDDCKLKLCGSTITLNGQAAFEIEGDLNGSGDKVIALKVTSDDTNQLRSTGIINSETPQFSYDMDVEVSSNSLKNIQISNSTQPLQYKGKVYKASEIGTLANGC